jgi:hypothetical protein
MTARSLRLVRPAALAVAAAALTAVLLPQALSADSIFDTFGFGRDMLPAAGPTRSLAGAVVASDDPLVASILSPCAAASAKYLTITGGFVHATTITENIGDEKKTTVGSVFPSIGVVVPLGRLRLLSGLYVEKHGGVTLAEVDTLTSAGTTGAGIIYDASYKREVSIHSVPIYVSTDIARRLVLSTGIVLSFCNLREENVMDFRDDDFEDTDDVVDAYAFGENFAGAFSLDLGRLRVGGLFRTGADLDGDLERINAPVGLWSTEDITISSRGAMRLGIQARPAPWISVEVDYDRNPWSRLELDGETLTDKLVERWALGVQYRGDFLWRADKYPLSLGYYRQPVDWQDAEVAGVVTGEITEQVFSLGISGSLGQDRGAAALGFEVGTRESDAGSDLSERFYALSLSISATEPWRREVRR